MVRRVLADVLDTEIVNHKGEADAFSGMFPKGRGPSDRGVAKLCKVYLEPIVRDAAGLKQAGRIANDRLKIHFAKFGYSPVTRTPSLWKHATKDICFSLVVDDFGVKHVGKDTADHLIQSLKKLYTISIDWTGSLY